MQRIQFLDPEVVADTLTTVLHGSGFDGKWQVEMGSPRGRATRLYATIGYHSMDEWGGYDGWFDVVLTMNAVTGDLLRVHFVASDYHRAKYITGVRDYFDDSAYYAVGQMQRLLKGE